MVDNKKLAEIFNLSESEVGEIREAVIDYNSEAKGQSYKDWCKMYDGIHHEMNGEIAVRNWLACMRWMKKKKADYIRSVIESMPDEKDLINDSKI